MPHLCLYTCIGMYIFLFHKFSSISGNLDWNDLNLWFTQNVQWGGGAHDHEQKHTLFSNSGCFAPLNDVYLVLKNNFYYVNFLQGWDPTSNTSPPPPPGRQTFAGACHFVSYSLLGSVNVVVNDSYINVEYVLSWRKQQHIQIPLTCSWSHLM